jgi:hypothetical protein
MSQPREHDFADELASLIERYADVPRGGRAMYLMTAIAALMAAEAGRVPTIREFGEMMLVMVRKLAQQGQVRQ